ncbi:methyltransferase family protein [Photobacterium ganghwense]|uniref:methyltransferase family protein n=1 Tax=Photobacterium ganghwense TaxID=320778 RepID=UPI001C2D5A24|nr:isoprenylcysteine carboxylmethyltransferase family protein [Photobacterium ganghwense]MBV1843509.1 isoprenylcysteine carboxylmethyltransferase family protein [Photobacterium ganghwense]
MYLRLPPPLVLLLSVFGMYLLAQLMPLYEFHFAGQRMLMLMFCLAGTLIGLAAVMSFARAKTTVNPHKPAKTSALVTTGIYRISRNPMYLALLCLLMAAFIYFSALSAVLMIGVFVMYMNHFQIAQEETVLKAMFGDRYEKYCHRVRRWC